MSTTTTYTGIRIVDLPDLGAVNDACSVVGEHSGSGRFSAPNLRTYVGAVSLPLTGGTLSGGLEINAPGGGAALVLKDPGAPVDNTTFALISSGGVLQGMVTDDAQTAQADFLRVERSGQTVTRLDLTGSAIHLNGAAQTSASLDVTGTMTAGSVISGGALSAATVFASGALAADSVAVTHGLTAANVTTSGVVRGSNGVEANSDGTFRLVAYGGFRQLNFSSQWNFGWMESNGDLMWDTPVGTAITFAGADGRNTSWHGPWAGNGAYIDISDERRKVDIEPASLGLAQVLAVAPISFRRLGAGDTPQPRTEIGFSAQQIAAVIPEAVSPIGSAKPGPHDLNGADPYLGVSVEPIVAALVGAVKELTTRLAALEARATP